MEQTEARGLRPWNQLPRSERVARDRLQPSLLDRLTDNEPTRRQEVREAAMLTHAELRMAVLRDLRWLLNTVNLQTTDDLSPYPQVPDSALNFGVHAMAGKRMSEIDWVDVEDSIRNAIAAFEPRILDSSVEVRCVTDTGTLEHHNVLSLEIKGMLWCVPHPMEFLFRTDIDLESGHMDLRDLGECGLMDARLLDYYNRELVYMRELGAEFAQMYPKVAGRLGMHGTEVADPYVERLLEGFSFLTARIHLKMDAEFPRFSQRLLEVVYPNYLAPTPAMAVVRFTPSMNEGTLARGFDLPRGTLLRGKVPRGEQTPCEFMTGHDVRLWPLRVVEAEFTGAPPDLPLARLGLGGRNGRVLSALRIRIEVCGGVRLEDMDLDQLVFHLAGQDLPMQRLLEVIMGHTVAVLGHDSARPVGWINKLPPSCVRHEGFADDQALLPADARVFQGYRLLQEYFAFPRRYLFFSLNDLKRGLRTPPLPAGARRETRTFDLTLLFSTAAPELEGAIAAEHLALHCAPVINLFPKRADRIAVTPRTNEYHVVIDRTRPLDYEVFALTRVLGHASAERPEQEFRSFYGTLGSDPDDYGAYYSMRREPRLLSEQAKRNGTRTGYTGSEVFVSLVDRHEAPFSGQLRHLTLETLCTNRDLAMLLPLGTDTDLTLRVSAPVASIKVLHGPTRPHAALAENAATWHLISHLGLNYLSLVDLDAEQGAQTLREMLQVYGNLADPVVRKHIAGVRHVLAEPMHHRLPVPGPIVYGRGVRIGLQIDETAFSGISPYLFGAVLEQFFARHVSINMMSELILSTLQRGEIARWKPRMGARPAV